MYQSEVISPEEFRSRREYLHLSRKELSNLWGVSRAWISFLESGKRDIKPWMDLALHSLEIQKRLKGSNDAD